MRDIHRSVHLPTMAGLCIVAVAVSGVLAAADAATPIVALVFGGVGSLFVTLLVGPALLRDAERDTPGGGVDFGGTAKSETSRHAREGRYERVVRRSPVASENRLIGDWETLQEGSSGIPHLATTLTTTERQVAMRVAEGQTAPEIAASLHITPNNVKRYLGQALFKLNVNNLEELREIVDRERERTS